MSHDTLIHRIVRPAVRRLAPTGVTPNQLTTLRLISGIAAALCFAQGGNTSPHIGAALFIVSMLLDRADGELSRQTGQSSPAGHRYDLISDCTTNVLAFLGIGVGLSQTELGRAAILLGILAGLGIAALFWQLNVLKLRKVVPYTAWDRRVVVDPDDTIIFVPILIWCGLAEPMLVAAAVVTPAIVLWLSVSALRSKSNREDDTAHP